MTLDKLSFQPGDLQAPAVTGDTVFEPVVNSLRTDVMRNTDINHPFAFIPYVVNDLLFLVFANELSHRRLLLLTVYLNLLLQ